MNHRLLSPSWWLQCIYMQILQNKHHALMDERWLVVWFCFIFLLLVVECFIFWEPLIQNIGAGDTYRSVFQTFPVVFYNWDYNSTAIFISSSFVKSRRKYGDQHLLSEIQDPRSDDELDFSGKSKTAILIY